MKGHDRANCNKLKKCDNCHATGHVKDNFYLLIGYPENFKGKKKVNTVNTGGAQLQEALDHTGRSAMHSRLHDEKVHMDRKIQGQEEYCGDIPNQLGQLIHKATPAQLQQMLEILQGNKEFLDSQSCVNLVDNPNYCLKWIIDTGASDHMINNHTYLHNKHTIRSTGQVQLPT